MGLGGLGPQGAQVECLPLGASLEHRLCVPGLKTGVTVLVDGVARKVRRRAMIDDGALTLIELEDA